MKEIKVKESIPIGNRGIVYHTVYVCETCDCSHSEKRTISQCPICGKDLCIYCEREHHLLTENKLAIDDWSKSLMLQDNYDFDKYARVCVNCLTKLREDEDSYLEKAQILIDKFNQDIANLTKRFIEEHKELNNESQKD